MSLFPRGVDPYFILFLFGGAARITTRRIQGTLLLDSSSTHDVFSHYV
jgi:hypothetical protein